MTKAPLKETKQIQVLSLEEAKLLILTMENIYKEHINGPYSINHYSSYIAVKIALGTGMRLGEVFGLCWDN